MPVIRPWRLKLADSLAADRVVSFASEELILVDDADREIGSCNKDACHDGDGVLHRAFSLFLFNDNGELLLQRRSEQKRLWPLYWSNSCCSHPRLGETLTVATERRLLEELGQMSKLEFLFKFQYQAKFRDKGSEHELCSVYLGTSSGAVRVNSNEIAEWRYVAPTELDMEIEQHPERFTPWLKMEWQRIRSEFADRIDALTK